MNGDDIPVRRAEIDYVRLGGVAFVTVDLIDAERLLFVSGWWVRVFHFNVYGQRLLPPLSGWGM